MEKYKCESCNEDFRTSFQLRNHFGLAHPIIRTVIVEVEPPEIKPVLNIWSGEIVDWDPMDNKPRKMKPDELCSTCGSDAYILEHGQPHCYGLWSTWGCHYSKDGIETDRKWYKIPCRKRNTYVSKILNKKERKKIIKTVAGLEREVWAEISWTPLEELEKWHDDKLRTEVRMLELVRSTNC
jgi:hypothetical protein